MTSPEFGLSVVSIIVLSFSVESVPIKYAGLFSIHLIFVKLHLCVNLNLPSCLKLPEMLSEKSYQRLVAIDSIFERTLSIVSCEVYLCLWLKSMSIYNCPQRFRIGVVAEFGKLKLGWP